MESEQTSSERPAGHAANLLTWSPSEKKVARKVFDGALTQELDAIMSTTKKMAAGIEKPSDLWDLEDYLTKSRKAVDEKFDYRYSQLLLLFARLLHEGRIQEEGLRGLMEDKIGYVRRVVDFRSSTEKPGKRKL